MATTLVLNRSKAVINVDSFSAQVSPQSTRAAEPHSRTAVVMNVRLVIAIAHAPIAALIEPIQRRHAPVIAGGRALRGSASSGSGDGPVVPTLLSGLTVTESQRRGKRATTPKPVAQPAAVQFEFKPWSFRLRGMRYSWQFRVARAGGSSRSAPTGEKAQSHRAVRSTRAGAGQERGCSFPLSRPPPEPATSRHKCREWSSAVAGAAASLLLI